MKKKFKFTPNIIRGIICSALVLIWGLWLLTSPESKVSLKKESEKKLPAFDELEVVKNIEPQINIKLGEEILIEGKNELKKNENEKTKEEKVENKKVENKVKEKPQKAPEDNKTTKEKLVKAEEKPPIKKVEKTTKEVEKAMVVYKDLGLFINQTASLIKTKEDKSKNKKILEKTLTTLKLPDATNETLKYINKQKKSNTPPSPDLRNMVTVKDEKSNEKWVPRYLKEKAQLEEKIERTKSDLDKVAFNLELIGIVENDLAIIKNHSMDKIDFLKLGDEYYGLKVLEIGSSQLILVNENVGKKYIKKLKT